MVGDESLFYNTVNWRISIIDIILSFRKLALIVTRADVLALNW